MTGPVPIPAIVVIGTLGLCVGSFLNVVSYRGPRGRSFVRGRSACPSCDACIAWYDDVPVLSWLALRGRCRRCRAAISVRYPLVELATGALFASCAALTGHATLLAALLGLVSAVVVAVGVRRPWRG